MGVKRAISLGDIPLKYQKYSLIPTSDGVSATVYLLGDRFVLKVFEPDSSIEDELKVLNSLNSPLIPKVVDSFKIDNLPKGPLNYYYFQIPGLNYPLKFLLIRRIPGLEEDWEAIF